MDLQELLDSVGLNKSQLAKLLGVSRSTVMRMGEGVSKEVLEVIDTYRLSNAASVTIPVPEMLEVTQEVGDRLREPEEYSVKEIKQLCMRRGTGGESDYEISCSIGISVFEFRGMIDRLVEYCQKNECTSASLL